MVQLTMQKGTLRSRAQNSKAITDMILLASAYADEDWADIEVITLKQSAKDRAVEELAGQVFYSLDFSAEDQINVLARAYMVDAYEFVRFDEDKITIAVDREVVNDEAVNHALHLLMQMDNFESGTTTHFKR